MNAGGNSLRRCARHALLAISLNLFVVTGSLKAEPAKYGEKQTTTMGTVIAFHDFDLTDHGESTMMLRSPRMCLWSRDFEVSRLGQRVRVSCMTLPRSPGPHPFEWNGKSFTLELIHSGTGVDEVVVKEK